MLSPTPPPPPTATASSAGTGPRGAPARTLGAVRSLRRAVRLHRRLLAGVSAAGAVAVGLGVAAPPPPPSTAVVVAATDLAGGAPLGPADLAVRRWPRDAVPAGTAGRPRRWLGRVLAGPVRAGEALTDARVLGPGLLRGHGPGLVAAPVRIADPAAVALVRTGDRVDVLAPDTGGRVPTAVAVHAAPVVAVPRVETELGAEAPGALLVLAVSPAEAQTLAAHSVLGPLLVTLRG